MDKRKTAKARTDYSPYLDQVGLLAALAAVALLVVVAPTF